ncbi:MAG: hypothetical protein ACC656_09565 [Candidatus Heimdallarchaeota archaeon]
MEKDSLSIKDDITKASTISSEFYFDSDIYEKSKEKIFSHTWQFIADTDKVRVSGQVYPHVLLEGCLDEIIRLAVSFELFLISNSNINFSSIFISEECSVKFKISIEGSLE